MKLLVLETIIDGRAELVRDGRDPPFVVHLPPKRATRLRHELDSLGVSFGIPFGLEVPDPRDDGEEWKYYGLVLTDVHVYGRVDRSSVR